jgi:hypothetical protein
MLKVNIIGENTLELVITIRPKKTWYVIQKLSQKLDVLDIRHALSLNASMQHPLIEKFNSDIHPLKEIS